MFPVIISILLSVAANATVTVNARIYDIDYGQDNEDTLLLLTSGEVAWVKRSQDKSTVGLLHLAKMSNSLVKFTLNAQSELLTSKTLSHSALTENEPILDPLYPNDLYTPTIVENVELAKVYFKEARKTVKEETQCFNRAHVWSYEWFQNHEVNSNKTWVFFTRRYIRNYRFKWWFHVAPSIAVVSEDGVVREHVMDVKYSTGPRVLKKWTDIFLRDKANCPKVATYSDYANFPETGSCYTMRTSMFYHQPFDIETKENDESIFKSNWVDEDLKQAYLEAFEEEI